LFQLREERAQGEALLVCQETEGRHQGQGHGKERRKRKERQRQIRRASLEEEDQGAADFAPLEVHDLCGNAAKLDISPLEAPEEWIKFNLDSGAAVSASPMHFSSGGTVGKPEVPSCRMPAGLA
jgi:hypothetical protein